MKKNEVFVQSNIGDIANNERGFSSVPEQFGNQLQEKNLLISKLQEENLRLHASSDANEHKLVQLSSWADDFQRMEQDLAVKDELIALLKHKETLFRQTAEALQDMLSLQSNNVSFRVARLLQMLNEPQRAGEKSRFAVLIKYLFSKLRGQKFAPDYHAFREITKQLSASLEQIDCLSAENSRLKAPDAPDDSVLISVVLPVYNQADLVHESIDSVLAQTYQNWELIIINDGSTDNLAEAVKPYLKDERIHYFEQQNQKLPKALSNGFSFARGEFLTWTSADNNMHPDMLSKLSAFLRSNPDTDMVYADYDVIDADGVPLHASWFRPQNKRHPESSELHLPRSTKTLNIVQDNFIGASFMYRRKIQTLFGDYDPQLGVEDYDYWMRINSMMKISHLGTDEILYSYRVHDNSLNGKAAEFKILEKCQTLMNYEKERYSFYFKSFDIFGTYQPSDLNTGNFLCKFHAPGEKPAEQMTAYSKNILLCRGSELHTYSPQDLKRYDFIGAFFDYGMANDAGKNAYRIRRFNIQCFARPGSEELRRLRVLTGNALECEPPELGKFAMISANNRLFFEATRSAEERSRTLPKLREVASGKILILLEGIGNGGMEQVAYDMTRSFARHGRSVLLASYQAPGKDVKLPDNIKLHILDKDDPEHDLRSLLEKEKYAAVFAHYCTRGAQTVHALNVPYFQVIHNTYAWFGTDEIKKYLEADEFTAAYIAVSANVAWYAIECMSLPSEKMIIIENSVELDRFTYSEKSRKDLRQKLNIADDEFLFLNPASFYGTKGQMNLVLAFAQAYKRNPKLRLLIAGKILEPKYYDDVQKIIAKNNLQKVVISGQFFSNMAEVYSAADAVVFGSYWEGCSLAVAETVRMKKPLLSPRIGDVERQTDCKNCFLFDLPFHYLTELTGVNCGAVVYSPNQHMIDSLEYGMLTVAIGDYPPADESIPPEQSADEVYQRYLEVLDYYSGNLAVEVFRHNI